MSCLSVFKNKPFQKNVQTGTFRIWKDLGSDKEYENFSFWPYETESLNKYTVCEAYPSLCRKELKETYKNNIKFKTKDHEDAYLIALYASQFTVSPYGSLKEGFILSRKS